MPNISSNEIINIKEDRCKQIDKQKKKFNNFKKVGKVI